MKLRGVREFWGGVFAAFAEDPRGSLKFCFQLPLLLFLGWMEHRGDDARDPLIEKFCEEEDKRALRDFHEYVTQLPPHLQDFSRYFGEPKFSPKEVREIVMSPAAKEMLVICPTLEKLVPYDIFHANFFTVIHDIGMDLDSMVHHEQVEAGVRVKIGRTTKCVAVENGGPDASAENMIARFDFELGRDRVTLPRWNQGMWEWLFDLLLVRPYVIPGYEAQVDGEYLVLVQSANIPRHDLHDGVTERTLLDKLRWETRRDQV